MYQLSDGAIVNLEYVSYITPPDKQGKCKIYIINDENYIQCTSWDAQGILKLADAMVWGVPETPDAPAEDC